MEKLQSFLGLAAEKQAVIINSALDLFGTNGFRKASMGDIADRSGVSKAILFHYFGTKKGLYLYLVDKCTRTLTDAIRASFDESVTDFFDRIQALTRIEISVLRQHPGLLAFLKGVYFETHDQVREALKGYLSPDQSGVVGKFFQLESMDTTRFKVGIDPGFVLEILAKYADGLIARNRNRSDHDFDALQADFDRCVVMFRNHFYKEKT